jgi:basic amino acid/polyamine antiporter, APA family
MSDVSQEQPPEGLFVRRSTGLVREASALDAAIFNAVFSAPVGATLAWGVFFALAVFPGSDLVTATLIAFVLNIPVLVMMSLLAASMPRTGGDYVWVSRILSPPLAVVSNFGAAFSALIGATFWARYFPVFGLGPILATLGVIFDKPDLIRWGNNFQTEKWWIFFGALSMIILMTAILIAGTRWVFRWQNAFWGIASIGTFIAFVVFLFGSSSSLQTHFNDLAHKFGGQGDVFHKIVNAAPATSAHPGDWSATAPAVFVIMTFMMWNWWSVYLAGELRSASNRNRQMGIMFGALIWDVVFLIIGVLLIYKVAGYSFMAGVNAGSPDYTIPTGPWYHFIAALVNNNDVLTILIVGSFAFWSLPAMVGNTFMPVRTVFAWAFDRLLPEKFAEVNPRTGSPIPAILLVMGIVTAMLIWSIEKTTFQTWLALGVLAGVVCVWIVCIAAFVFPDRRPDLYQASPANIDVGGIPLLKIVSPLSFLAMCFLVFDTLKYPDLALSGDSSHRWYVPAFMLATAAFGLLVYYGARFWRRDQDIDVDLVYRELPPD